jgi:thioredoxin-related protein
MTVPSRVGLAFATWVILIAMAVPSQAMAAGTADPEDFYQIPAFGDFQANLNKALDKGKKGILLYFHQAQCPFCQKMEREVFSQPIVHKFFQKYFDVYKVNIKGNKQFTDVDGDSLSQMKFAVQNRARATPTLVVFGKGGEELVRFISNPSLEEFLALGKFVVDGRHREGEDFFNYKSQQATKGIQEKIREDYL